MTTTRSANGNVRPRTRIATSLSPMSSVERQMDNRLLDALPEADCARLRPHLEPVRLPLGLSVYESGGAQGYLYFPRSAIVSLLHVLKNGASAEIAVAGNDG